MHHKTNDITEFGLVISKKVDRVIAVKSKFSGIENFPGKKSVNLPMGQNKTKVVRAVAVPRLEKIVLASSYGYKGPGPLGFLKELTQSYWNVPTTDIYIYATIIQSKQIIITGLVLISWKAIIANVLIFSFTCYFSFAFSASSC